MHRCLANEAWECGVDTESGQQLMAQCVEAWSMVLAVKRERWSVETAVLVVVC